MQGRVSNFLKAPGRNIPEATAPEILHLGALGTGETNQKHGRLRTGEGGIQRIAGAIALYEIQRGQLICGPKGIPFQSRGRNGAEQK